MKVRHVTHRDEEPDTLGAYLKRARGKMSQDELAKKIGVSGRKAIIRWESGEHIPSEINREKLIAALKLQTDVYDELARTAQEEARLEPRVVRLEEVVERLERHLFGEAAAQGR